MFIRQPRNTQPIDRDTEDAMFEAFMAHASTKPMYGIVCLGYNPIDHNSQFRSAYPVHPSSPTSPLSPTACATIQDHRGVTLTGASVVISK